MNMNFDLFITDILKYILIKYICKKLFAIHRIATIGMASTTPNTTRTPFQDITNTHSLGKIIAKTLKSAIICSATELCDVLYCNRP